MRGYTLLAAALLGLTACEDPAGPEPSRVSRAQALESWGAPEELLYTDPIDRDYGYGVGASGDLAVGFGGATVYLFKHSDQGWQELEPLRPLGRVVSFSDDTLLTIRDRDNGGTSVYVRSGDTLVHEVDLSPEIEPGSSHDWKGLGVAYSSDTIMLAEPQFGKVYVFERTGTSWVQTQVLQGEGPEPNQSFGFGVALSADTAVVGAYSIAYVYIKEHGSWVLQQKLLPPSPPPTVRFFDPMLSGDTVAFRSDALLFLFARSGGTWEQQAALSLPNSGSGSPAVAIRGDTVLTGDSWANAHAGAAYVFRRNGGVWSSAQPLPTQHAAFGKAVALWDGGAVVSALNENIEPGHGPYGRAYLLAYSPFNDPDACAGSADCQSGQCVEGVCCNTACDGSCESCLASRKGFGLDGFCGPAITSDACLSETGSGGEDPGGGASAGEDSGGAAAGAPATSDEQGRERHEPSRTGCQMTRGARTRPWPLGGVGLAGLLSGLRRRRGRLLARRGGMFRVG